MKPIKRNPSKVLSLNRVNMNRVNKLRAIAYEVRKQCEKFARSSRSSQYDFHGNDDLECMCAVASYTLCTELEKHGISCQMVCGEFCEPDYCNFDENSLQANHCWVECGDLVVDVTATQFGSYRRVVITRTELGMGKNFHSMYYGDDAMYETSTWECSQRPNDSLAAKIMETA